MKYELLEWDADELRTHGLIEGILEMPCMICKEPTRFIDYCTEARICSERCMNKQNAILTGLSKGVEKLEEDGVKFGTAEQMADYLGVSVSSLVGAILWDMLKNNTITDADIVKAAEEHRR